MPDIINVIKIIVAIPFFIFSVWFIYNIFGIVGILVTACIIAYGFSREKQTGKNFWAKEEK